MSGRGTEKRSQISLTMRATTAAGLTAVAVAASLAAAFLDGHERSAAACLALLLIGILGAVAFFPRGPVAIAHLTAVLLVPLVSLMAVGFALTGLHVLMPNV